MYCKKCGYLLVSGEEKCRHCKEPVDTAEMCGGFWGLVGEDEPTKITPPTIEQPKPVEKPVEKKLPKGVMRIKKSFFFAISGLALLFFVISTVLLIAIFKVNSNYKNEIKDLKMTITELETSQSEDEGQTEQVEEETNTEEGENTSSMTNIKRKDYGSDEEYAITLHYDYEMQLENCSEYSFIEEFKQEAVAIQFDNALENYIKYLEKVNTDLENKLTEYKEESDNPFYPPIEEEYSNKPGYIDGLQIYNSDLRNEMMSYDSNYESSYESKLQSSLKKYISTLEKAREELYKKSAEVGNEE